MNNPQKSDKGTDTNVPARTLDAPESLAWQQEGLAFNAFGAWLRRRFGGRIQRVSIDAGFTCPNVDGAVLRGGCNFCDNRSFSPSRRVRLASMLEQLQRGITSVRRRYTKVAGFIAYLQPATNTYGPLDQLETLYRAALDASPEVIGLAIGTRPDCVPDPVLDLIDTLAAEHYVSLEYGMQTVHDRSLDWMNRGHHHHSMVDAMRRSRGRRFETCAHVILGIPGESHADMMQTAQQIGPLGVDAVKLHNLYAVRGTPLGEQVLAGEVKMMAREDYIHSVVDFLERIPPQVIVERVSGDAPPDFLIEPQWCLEKSLLRRQIEAEFARRGTRQGDRYDRSIAGLPAAPDEAETESSAETAVSEETKTPKEFKTPAELKTPAGVSTPAGAKVADQTPAAIRQRIARARTLPVLKLSDET
ncbi:TIGR01212 family radical SAM protein [Roseimaritima sediminicola]|uniref:TIGR01212 family radical SAM protein n=1 Tax=Roseimaritima sediminicola TaxID=2662066 RepID=UPI0036F1AF3D